MKKLIKKFCQKQIKNIDDFNDIIKDANNKNIISMDSKKIIDGALQTVNLKVRDIMVPKSKMVMIKSESSFDDYLKITISSAHSRLPVITNNKIEGIILAKDMLAFMANNGNDKFIYKDYLREANVIPESKSLESLLNFFQQKRSHMMIVIDEYGELAGLITLEDVLEQIVGEIDDEHDFEEDDIIDYGNGRFLIRAHTSLDDFNNFFDVKFNGKGIDSIGGMIAQKFGYLPKQLEEIVIEDIKFKVLKANSRKIKLLEIIK